MNRPAVVCTPLLAEYVALRPAMGRAAAAGAVRVARTGMGPRRSQESAARLSGAASAVLVAGVAGALDPSLRPGDVVVASAVCDESGQRVECTSASPLAEAVQRCGLVAHLGLVMCTSRLAGERARQSHSSSGALAVEMEAINFADLAAGLPFAVLRVVVDTPDAPLLRLGTIGRGIRALHILRRCAPAIADWAATLRTVPDASARQLERLPGSTGAASYREDAAAGVEFITPREVT